MSPKRPERNLLEPILAAITLLLVLVGYLKIFKGSGIPTAKDVTTTQSVAPSNALSQSPSIDRTPPTRRGRFQITDDRADQAAETATLPPVPKGNIIAFDLKDGLAIAYGDQILGEPAPEDLAAMRDAPRSRRAFDAPSPQLWDKPIIPYAINPALPNPERVRAAIDQFNQTTVVKFVPWQGEPDAIVFEKGTENCLSYLGRMGGAQPIRLANGCGTQEIMHEMLHALGFVHEHSRTDRDQYVEVLWNHIKDDYKSQYVVVPESFMDASRTGDFDPASIMIYAPDTFALSPNQPTLRVRSGAPIAPTAHGLSEGDKMRLRRLYPSAQ